MKHWEYHPEPEDDCFGCKAMGLQMNTGDAKRDIPDKKWNSELQAYRDARAQGKVLGKAYNADTMPKTKDINEKSAAVMKEIGQI